VVVPRTTEAGAAALAVGVGLPFRLPDGGVRWEVVVDLGQVTILPQE
jgi:hypothetical protein